jgi:hypothetical protein
MFKILRVKCRWTNLPSALTDSLHDSWRNHMENHLEYPSSDDHFSNHLSITQCAIVEARKPDISISSLMYNDEEHWWVGLNKINGIILKYFCVQKNLLTPLYLNLT